MREKRLRERQRERQRERERERERQTDKAHRFLIHFFDTLQRNTAARCLPYRSFCQIKTIIFRSGGQVRPLVLRPAGGDLGGMDSGNPPV